jgi:dsRNA-specific ribonuclease
MSKKSLPLEFIIYAQIGDAILNRVVIDLLDAHNVCSQATKGLLLGEIKSNKFIKDWPPLLKVKFVNINKMGIAQKIKMKGDVVEASIAFLYLNNGLAAAERYIKTNLIKSLKQTTWNQ